MGYVWRRARAMPNLNLTKKRQRKKFANRYKSYSFKNFVFADETKIEINTFPLYHFRQKTSKPVSVGTREKSSLKINIWVAISYKGPTRFCLFTNNLNQYSYKYILEFYLKPSMISNFNEEELESCFLIQDNDPKHTSNLCTEFLRENSINWLKTPANSADFNPIEMLWSDLKSYVRKKQCRNLSELTETIRSYERNLNAEKCTKYVRHLKKVLNIVADKEKNKTNKF
ncbi:Transposable element Tcb2 transposase [Brachionus plicatilis]|uniref:Transposable element Tcb2 transposase n=1 Tax=Brachionus plicatilis TaxID=10195 RepID=A0A3M7RXY2_BRAPC|nr:Transposable element Tcb2 transposase [Brachionus plicatilis]